MVPRLIGSQEELNVPTKIARIYRRYLLANARGNVDWSYRWFALFERAVRDVAAATVFNRARQEQHN